jgi:hypothetical protein
LLDIHSKLTDGQYACLLRDGDSTSIFIFDVKNNYVSRPTITHEEIDLHGSLDHNRFKSNYEKVLPHLKPADKDAIDNKLKPGDTISVRLEVPQLYTEQVQGRKIFEPPINAKHILDLNLVKTTDGVISYKYFSGAVYVALPYLDDEVTFVPSIIPYINPITIQAINPVGSITIQSVNPPATYQYNQALMRTYKNVASIFTYNEKNILILENMNTRFRDANLNNRWLGLPYIDAQNNIFFYHDPDSLIKDHGDRITESNYRVVWLLGVKLYPGIDTRLIGPHLLEIMQLMDIVNQVAPHDTESSRHLFERFLTNIAHTLGTSVHPETRFVYLNSDTFPDTEGHKINLERSHTDIKPFASQGFRIGEEHPPPVAT